jgi:hypothetical protein
MNETFQEYAARILSLSAGQDPYAVLAQTPGRIGALLAGRSAQDLRWTPSPSRWSIAQVVAHLADAEIVGGYRFGVHAERGKESVRHLISLYAGHDLNHLAQIERLIAERGRA